MRELKFRAWNSDDSVMITDLNSPALAHGVLISDDEDTLMQFTGLQDKNGVDIYEGDLVLVRGVRVSEVVFHEQAGCWDLKLRNVISSESIGAVSPSSYKYHTEVIGNIYEHPELLEGGA